MKSVLIYCTLFVAMIVLASSHLITLRKGNEDLWNEYKRYYGKKYAPEEDKVRRATWDGMVNTMFNHNILYHSGNKSYHLGINQYTDMDHDNFQSTVTGLNDEVNCQTNSSMLYQPPTSASIPPHLDWYKRGYVTEVLNQGACGACWAFCSIASLEGQHKRITGKLVKLSEQHLIDCSHKSGNKGCDGGQMCRAFEYASDVGGVDTEKSYPLTTEAGECKYSKHKMGSRVGGYLEIPYGDEDALLKAVALIGPIAAGVDGSRPHFRHYKGGIFDNDECSNTTLNHAVTVIGYGIERGKPYWLIKNSWSKSWGVNGFGKMVRNKNNQCGLASKALFPVLYKDEFRRPILNGSRAS